MNNMKRNACQKCAFAVHDDNPHCGLRGFTTCFNVEWCSAENDKASNGYELQEDGYFSWVKKKKEYPKKFVECCTILYPNDNFQIVSQRVKGHKGDLLFHFQKLLICRDAYWEIAGEEMGLGKPWEPDWNDSNPKYTITVLEDKLVKHFALTQNYILAFPTEEMRDAFYEAFKELIEKCKEFL